MFTFEIDEIKAFQKDLNIIVEDVKYTVPYNTKEIIKNLETGRLEAKDIGNKVIKVLIKGSDNKWYIHTMEKNTWYQNNNAL